MHKYNIITPAIKLTEDLETLKVLKGKYDKNSRRKIFIILTQLLSVQSDRI